MQIEQKNLRIETRGIPFQQGELCLGTWQDCFLWEHRESGHSRKLVLTCCGD